jgi:hypothetical protein
MQEIEDYSDERQKVWCIQCGKTIRSRSTNWDHVPTKGLLERPLPAHVPQIEVCEVCNNGFSLDEEYFITFLSCVLSGSTAPEMQRNPKIGRALKRNPSLAARLDAAQSTFTDDDDIPRLMWRPEMERIKRVIIKNGRGHVFYEFCEPMFDEPSHVWAVPLVTLEQHERQRFEDINMSVWPEVGSRMMMRFAQMMDHTADGMDMVNGWVVVQEGIYRYAVFQENGLVVRSVIHNYLATEVIWD